MDPQDNITKETVRLNAQGQMINGENIGCAFGHISVAQSPNVLGNVEQDIKDILREHDGRLIASQVAYRRACNGYNQTTSGTVLQQNTNNFYAPDAQVAVASCYEDNSAHIDSTVIQQRVSYGSSQAQQFGGAPDNVHTYASAFNNMVPYVQLLPQQMGSPVNTTSFRLMHIRGQVAAFCSNAYGSLFIQQAIEVATTEEIIMVYEEIVPYAFRLSIDVFGNQAIQKILNHGPQFYKRMLIHHLMGHVFSLSLDMCGYQVIQKFFDVAEQDQKVEMAKELSSKVLICVCDKFANFVIQKCIERLPSKHIKFIFRCFYGNALALSTHRYGWHVVKKLLAHCRRNIEVHHTIAEIIELAETLSIDQYGNYVVQYLVEHGSPINRSMIVNKFVGQIVNMSYHMHASNVIEKCLTFGCHNDRQLIANEIIGDGGSQQLMDMMIHPYANLVIQKMLVTVEEEEQIGLLLGVVRRNLANLKSNHYGRHVIAAIENFVAAKARMMVLRAQSPLPPQ